MAIGKCEYVCGGCGFLVDMTENPSECPRCYTVINMLLPLPVEPVEVCESCKGSKIDPEEKHHTPLDGGAHYPCPVCLGTGKKPLPEPKVGSISKEKLLEMAKEYLSVTSDEELLSKISSLSPAPTEICEFDKHGACHARVCYSSQKCSAKDKDGGICMVEDVDNCKVCGLADFICMARDNNASEYDTPAPHPSGTILSVLDELIEPVYPRERIEKSKQTALAQIAEIRRGEWERIIAKIKEKKLVHFNAGIEEAIDIIRRELNREQEGKL